MLGLPIEQWVAKTNGHSVMGNPFNTTVNETRMAAWAIYNFYLTDRLSISAGLLLQPKEETSRLWCYPTPKSPYGWRRRKKAVGVTGLIVIFVLVTELVPETSTQLVPRPLLRLLVCD